MKSSLVKFNRVAWGTLRSMVLGMAIGAIACAGWAGAAQTDDSGTSAKDQRPNIVFAFADDWGRYSSAYAKLQPGGPSDLVSTPNFDRVANEGVLFTQAYVNAPSCTPCRSSLLSGQYFWRCGRGAILSGAVWDASIPSYPLLLESAGYHIGHTYKVWSPGTPVDAPYGGQRTAYVSAGRRFNAYSQFVSKSPDKRAAQEQLLGEVRQNFQAFLDARQDGQPFCYWFGPTNCHRKWVRGSGKRLWNLDPDALKGKLPGYLPDVPEVREDFADYLGEVQAFDAALGVLIEQLQAANQWDNTILVVSGDHGIPGVPRGKCNLYDLGVRVGLAICWPRRVAANRVVDDFVCLPDLAPTFLQAAGVERPSEMTAESLMTILTSDQSGIVQAHRDHVIVGRERHVGNARTGNLPYPQRAIRTRDYLYIYNFAPDRWPMGTAPGYGRDDSLDDVSNEQLTEVTLSAFADIDASPTKAYMVADRKQDAGQQRFEMTFGLRPQEELFDVRNDPDHLHNLAASEKHQKIKSELHARLFATLKSSGDPRVVQSDPVFEHPPFAGEPQNKKKKAGGKSGR